MIDFDFMIGEGEFAHLKDHIERLQITYAETEQQVPEGDFQIRGAITPKTAKDFGKFMSETKADNVTIGINSPGGLVDSGSEILSIMEDSDKSFTTKNFGLAASMASAIFFAGDKRMAGSNTKVMLHYPWGITVGNSRMHQQRFESLRASNETFLDLYARAGFDRAELVKKLDVGDHYITAKSLFDKGLAEKFETKKSTAQRGHVVLKLAGGSPLKIRLYKEDDSDDCI